MHEGLHPALGLSAIEGVADVAGQGIAKTLQVGNQLFQGGFIVAAKFFPGGIAAEKNSVFVPAGEGEAAKPQDDFLRVRRSVGTDGLGVEGNDWSKSRGRAVEEKLRFTARYEPGSDVAGGAGVHAFERFPPGIEFVEFDCEALVEGTETICEDR